MKSCRSWYLSKRQNTAQRRALSSLQSFPYHLPLPLSSDVFCLSICVTGPLCFRFCFDVMFGCLEFRVNHRCYISVHSLILEYKWALNTFFCMIWLVRDCQEYASNVACVMTVDMDISVYHEVLYCCKLYHGKGSSMLHVHTYTCLSHTKRTITGRSIYRGHIMNACQNL